MQTSMTTATRHHLDMDRSPVEIRFAALDLVLVVWYTGHGTLSYELSQGCQMHPVDIRTLNCREPFPRKAVEGWQAEVINVVRSSALGGDITEIR